jgi:type VI secretion system protein ImpK
MVQTVQRNVSDEPTLIRPRPGGSRANAPLFAEDGTASVTRLEDSPVQAMPATFETPDLRVPTFFGKRLPLVVGAAVPLLNLASRIAASSQPVNPASLRQQAIASLRDYERRLASSQVPIEQARIAHYSVCAALDDVVLAKPWGASGEWSRNGLVPTFHMDVTGGERFFDLLAYLHKDAGSNRDLLYLMYLCLSLGFEGRMRVSPQGHLELQRIREGLYRTLRSLFGELEREISPHWRGVNAEHRPPRPSMLLYATAGAMALLLALGFFGFTLALNVRSDGTLAKLATLGPNTAASLAVIERPVEVVEVVEPTPQIDRAAGLRAFLQPEIDAKTLTLTERPNGALIRIVTGSLFGSGSATLADEFKPLIARIAKESAEKGYSAAVTGHTDNVPIRSNIRFPSNFDLSKGRADVVAEIMRQHLPGNRVTSEGRADTEPLQPNDTQEGRAANRRTEIFVSWQNIDNTAPAEEADQPADATEPQTQQ